jgi:hypothetical protein
MPIYFAGNKKFFANNYPEAVEKYHRNGMVDELCMVIPLEQQPKSYLATLTPQEQKLLEDKRNEVHNN